MLLFFVVVVGGWGFVLVVVFVIFFRVSSTFIGDFSLAIFVFSSLLRQIRCESRRGIIQLESSHDIN